MDDPVVAPLLETNDHHQAKNTVEIDGTVELNGNFKIDDSVAQAQVLN